MGVAPLPAAERRRRLRSRVSFALVGRASAAALAVAALGFLAIPSTGRAEDEVPEAVRAIDAADGVDRGAAAKALGARPDADDLIVIWLRDGERRAKLGAPALEALARLAGERKLQLANSGLRALVRDSAQPLAVRETAARTLGVTGSIADVSALADALNDIPDACCRSLVAIGGDAALGALRRGMTSDPPPVAIAALAKFGDTSGLAALVEKLDAPADRDAIAGLLRWATGRDLAADKATWSRFLAQVDLADRFGSADSDAAQAAVEEAAAKIRTSGRDVGGIVAAVLADPQFPVFARSKAALTLGLSGLPSWNAELLAATANGQPGDVRWAAGNALARVGDLSCVVPLVKMLVHDEDRDRLAAKRSLKGEFSPVDPSFVRALHRLGIRGATMPLLELFAGEYRTGLHRDALRALGEVSDGETFEFQPDSATPDRLASLEKMKAWWREARERIPIAPRADDPGAAALQADIANLIPELGTFKFLYQLRAKKALTLLAEPAAEQLVAALAADSTQIRIGAADVMEGSTLRAFAAPLAARLSVEPNTAVKTKLLGALATCARRDAAGNVPSADAVLAAVNAALADRDLDVRIAAVRVLGVVGVGSDAARIAGLADLPRNKVDGFADAALGARFLLGDRTALPGLCTLLRSDEIARVAETVRVLRLAKCDLHGFDPDGAPEARESAVRAIESDPAAVVPKGIQK
ncbi:MAG: hypothetical protein K8T90_06885 [Planctomycetes bacterium]|nr:hypothetical protein [Planctomycetota bacterium]